MREAGEKKLRALLDQSDREYSAKARRAKSPVLADARRSHARGQARNVARGEKKLRSLVAEGRRDHARRRKQANSPVLQDAKASYQKAIAGLHGEPKGCGFH